MLCSGKPVPAAAPNVTDTPIEDAYHSGSRSYELSNHLGNVLATISDKKVGVVAQPSDTVVSHFVADITSTQDYYPFGMLMPGRRGAQVGGGWAEGGSSGGSGVPQSLTLESRDAAVGAYKASQEITFEPGFGSSAGDAFLAEITQGGIGGSGSGGFNTAGGGYRYGFNGKESDNEIKGEGAQQDYGLRIYDPRLGKFLSVDPFTKSYSSLTPYQFASDNPVAGIDLDGGEFKYYSLHWQAQADGKTHLSLNKQIGTVNRSFSTAVTATGMVRPTLVLPGTRFTPPLISATDKFRKELNFTMEDLGISPIVVSPDGKAWKVVPAYMDLNDLPQLNDPVWNTLESPEEFVERLIDDGNRIVGGAQNVSKVLSMLHGARKNGHIGATNNAGNAKGAAREQLAAEISGGQIAKIGNRDFKATIKKGGKDFSATVDVIGGGGEFITVGGAAKADKLGSWGAHLSRLKEIAAAKGVKAQAYLDADSPQNLIDFTKKRLGDANVVIMPKIQ